MADIRKITGYFNIGSGYKDENYWEGSIIVSEDGWFEGIVVDGSDKPHFKRFVCGVLVDNKHIELIKLTPEGVSAPIIFKNDMFNNTNYSGNFYGISLFGERLIGSSKINIQDNFFVLNNEAEMNLCSDINYFKINMDMSNKSFYENTLLTKKDMINILTKNAKGEKFTSKEKEHYKKVEKESKNPMVDFYNDLSKEHLEKEHQAASEFTLLEQMKYISDEVLASQMEDAISRQKELDEYLAMNIQSLEQSLSRLKFISKGSNSGNKLEYRLNLDGENITGIIYSLSINPLRIIKYVLDNTNVANTTVGDKNEISEIIVDREDLHLLIKTTNEVLSMRCFGKIETKYQNIMRQLPFGIAMQESDNLISIDEPHAIYKSARGGYNIKTLKYYNNNLNHYSSYNSRKWD